MVVLQKATESVSALDIAESPTDIDTAVDQAVVQALVISFAVIMFQELTNGVPK